MQTVHRHHIHVLGQPRLERLLLWRLDARLPRDRRADFRGRAILFHDRPDGRGFDGIDDKVGESGDGVAIPEGCDAGA
jgi:hypothetical protein